MSDVNAAAPDVNVAGAQDQSGASPVAEPVYHRKYGPRTAALEVVCSFAPFIAHTFQVLKDVDLKGKTILITGTTSGIGIETARALAVKGAHVVMANRNIVASENLRDTIYKEVGCQ